MRIEVLICLDVTHLHGNQAVVDHDLLGKADLYISRIGSGTNSGKSRTHKSAPIVALYWLENRLLTYWFMSDVLPTLGEITSQVQYSTGGPKAHTRSLLE